jgi:hypothetical protein
VNDTSGIRLSSLIDLPMSAPPQIIDDKAPGRELRVRTRSMILDKREQTDNVTGRSATSTEVNLVVAMLVNGVVGAPFLEQRYARVSRRRTTNDGHFTRV